MGEIDFSWIFYLLCLGFACICFLVSYIRKKKAQKAILEKEKQKLQNEYIKEQEKRTKQLLKENKRKEREKQRELEKEELRNEKISKIEISSEWKYNSVNGFFEDRKKMNNPQVTGCYILTNTDSNWHYVGQAQDVFSRVNNHFIGKGNGDVYADYKYGKNFTIEIVSLVNSGYYSLNELEHDLIIKNNADREYNKNQGISNNGRS